ncbi:cardiolipin synthetase [Roseivivax sp. THAF40]|uniref:phospholipase D-like domain-containing protein n=1 Tax=unclassified Roseivivax TaxID=2639302 RepID=UPI0012689E40|nr:MULTISPECIES: phospholipase D family protein [unclassified Roseivivax]QFS81888.1 cardiolipin synthetase [Roseivivax sp. THAF197b]QFT45688.1 cardiolipin synthetase [Roseivivax sp. THAF40]
MTLKALITAAEVYPALERMVAAAEEEVLLSFRIFDPETALRLPELRDRGLMTWADLITSVAQRGARVRIILTDFDPLFASPLHRAAWASASRLADEAEGDLQVLCAPHGQEVGWAWRSMLWLKIAEKLRLLREEPSDKLTPVQRAMLKVRPQLRPVSIHQKCAVVDGKDCMIGGLDINERRWDDNDHDRPGEETWHDVSMAVDGPFAAIARAHLIETWNAAFEGGAADLGTDAEPMQSATRPQGTQDLRLVRTVSAPKRGPFAFGPKLHHREHEETLIRAFGAARRSIYVETQFLRHRPITKALISAAEAHPDLNLIVLLPIEPERILYEGDRSLNARHAHALQTKALNDIVAAFGDRVALVTPTRRHPSDDSDYETIHGAAAIYVHAKVTLIDDDFGMVGSANLNGRSLRWDTEASVLFRDAEAVGDLRKRLAEKWLGHAAREGNIETAALWRETAHANKELAPGERSGFVVPYPMGRARRFSRFLPILPADMF